MAVNWKSVDNMAEAVGETGPSNLREMKTVSLHWVHSNPNHPSNHDQQFAEAVLAYK